MEWPKRGTDNRRATTIGVAREPTYKKGRSTDAHEASCAVTDNVGGSRSAATSYGMPPLAPNVPILLRGAPLTPSPSTGPHKPNFTIQTRLSPELIAAIIEARKKGQQLQFEAYGPNAGFHVDGQHFPIHSVTAERTPTELYAFTAHPQPSLQVVGKIFGKCSVQRTLTEDDQEKLLQSRSAAETANARTIGRIGVPDAPAKSSEKKRPTVRKGVLTGVLTASTVATALRASPAPGTAANSPPPGASSRPPDGPPNAFQGLLIHHLAYAPTSLKQLAAAVKRQPKEVRPCLDSVRPLFSPISNIQTSLQIATSDDTLTGPRLDSPTWTLKPASYQYLRLAPPTSASGGSWLTLSPDDIKRITADANRAFDDLKLPPDAPPRLALAAQQPAPPAPAPAPTPPATSAKPSEPSTLKHPLPARPPPAVASATPNGRLDVPKPSRVPSPAAGTDASSREMSVDTPRAPPVRPPVRVTTKEKAKPADDSEPPKDVAPAKKSGTGTKSKSGANGKEKSKIKSKPIITGDSDGEDFVPTKRDRERKPPPVVAAPAPAPPRPTAHSRAGSSSSTKQVEATAGAKRSKRDADIALELERELDSGYAESGRPAAPPTAATKPAVEGKKRRMNEDEPRVRERDGNRDKDREGVKTKKVDKVKKAVTATATAAADVERLVTKDGSEKRKRRDADQESDVSLDLELKKKRRVDPPARTPIPPKREKPPLERERERESESSAVEARPKKPMPNREPNAKPRVKDKPRKSTAAVGSKTNGVPATVATSSTVSAHPKVNGSSKKDRASLMYTSSEDEGTPAPRRPAPTPTTAPPPARVPKSAPVQSPSEGSTPRERDRERDRRKPPTDGFVLPPKRPPLPANATAADMRERYTEMYAEYATMGARIAKERLKVEKLLKDMDDGDHDSLDMTLIENLTKAYREVHEELAALRERLGAGP
ncbi:Smooth muscle caldesmon [Ceratobasidium theobromae]|uniref:Smooth muscle caldesmon n=1 Tax=Ceratobasidium theobromae TaxID=1582974 RepID=A0A5N5QW84_9AGAM|nr:Smooth muscle caldesmon [Ceratobasidium theobromae]